MSETLVCFSDELAVSLKPLADFRIAVNVIISVLFKQPCPLQSPSMMDINCFCGKVTIITFCCQYVQGSYSFKLSKFHDFPWLFHNHFKVSKWFNSSSVSWIPQTTCQSGKWRIHKQNSLAPGYRTLLSSHAALGYAVTFEIFQNFSFHQNVCRFCCLLMSIFFIVLALTSAVTNLPKVTLIFHDFLSACRVK